MRVPSKNFFPFFIFSSDPIREMLDLLEPRFIVENRIFVFVFSFFCGGLVRRGLILVLLWIPLRSSKMPLDVLHASALAAYYFDQPFFPIVCNKATKFFFLLIFFFFSISKQILITSI